MSLFTTQEVWDLVLKNEGILKQETRKFLPPSRRAEFETMYSDVVLARAHSIMRNYREGRGASPLTFLTKNCAWYAFEWVKNRKYKKRVEDQAVPLDDVGRGAGPAYNCTAETRAWVSHILERLPEDMRLVLEWHYLKNFDLLEIAKHLGVRKVDVQEKIKSALFVAGIYAYDDREPEAMGGETAAVRRDDNDEHDGASLQAGRDAGHGPAEVRAALHDVRDEAPEVHASLLPEDDEARLNACDIAGLGAVSAH